MPRRRPARAVRRNPPPGGRSRPRSSIGTRRPNLQIPAGSRLVINVGVQDPEPGLPDRSSAVVKYEAVIAESVDLAMRMAEVNAADALFGALLNVTEIAHQPPHNESPRMRGPAHDLINPRLEEPVVSIMPPRGRGVMPEIVPAAREPRGRQLAVGRIAMQKQAAAQPQVKAVPRKIRKPFAELRQPRDEALVVVVVP